MKVIILQENLNKGLAVVSRIITPRPTLPILSNIFLTAKEGKLKLTATNLEMSINLCLPAKKEIEGSLTVPAKELTEFVASLPAEKITLEAKKEKLYLKSPGYQAVFNGLSALEYPAVPSLLDKTKSSAVKQEFILEAKEFITAVQSVCFSASIDETRPVLTGVRLSFTTGQMQMVATDGYRLSLKKTQIKEKIKIPFLILPAKTLLEIVKIIQSEKEETIIKISIMKDAGQIIFSFGETEIATRLIEGEFPDFEKIIPSHQENKATIDKEEFNQAIKACAIFSRRSANIIKLNFSNDELIIKANAPELGENEVQLGIKYQGESMQIAFNYRFLQDFINNFTYDSFILELLGPLKPGVFKSTKDNSFLHVIMPVRVQEE